MKQLVKAHRALAAAEHDLQGGYPDAAASRAYYCVFHGARAALLTVGVQPKTHRGVNERFNMDLVLPGKIEAEYLSILGREQTERETADYSV
ncbi:MAG: HEPN domain-containing protein, partial [Myxococcota bacterium]